MAARGRRGTRQGSHAPSPGRRPSTAAGPAGGVAAKAIRLACIGSSASVWRAAAGAIGRMTPPPPLLLLAGAALTQRPARLRAISLFRALTHHRTHPQIMSSSLAPRTLLRATAPVLRTPLVGRQPFAPRAVAVRCPPSLPMSESLESRPPEIGAGSGRKLTGPLLSLHPTGLAAAAPGNLHPAQAAQGAFTRQAGRCARAHARSHLPTPRSRPAPILNAFLTPTSFRPPFHSLRVTPCPTRPRRTVRAGPSASSAVSPSSSFLSAAGRGSGARS
jgi:hypothetical protein